MIEESNITVVKLKRKNKNSKSNKNIKYQYINTPITIKITKQNMTLSTLHSKYLEHFDKNNILSVRVNLLHAVFGASVIWHLSHHASYLQW